MSAAERGGDNQAVPRRKARRHGGLLLLWSLAWSALALAMLTSYQPLLQMTRRAIDYSFTQRAIARNLSEAGANEALWYANYGLINLSVNAYGCDAPWTTSCIDKGAPLVDFTNDGMIRAGDILAATQTPYHGSHGWIVSNNSTTYTKTGSLTAGDGSGQVVGNYWAQVSRLHLPQPWIVARGCVPQGCNPDTGAGATHWRVTKVVLERIKPQALYAAFGYDRLILDNRVQIDSYDSGQGGYGGANIGQKVRIGTNGYGSSPEVQILTTNILVQGKLMVAPGTSVSTPGGAPITDYVPGGQIQQQDQRLPPVSSAHISDVFGGIIGYSAAPPGVTGSGGDYTIPNGVTWTCIAPTRVKSLDVLWGGEFKMGAGCQLLVDNDNTATWALNTFSGGKITKTEAGTTTQIFVKNGVFNLSGYGASFLNDGTIPEADKDPPKFQLFVTCTSPCNYTQTPILAQTRTFYGVVYVENGPLDLQRATLDAVNYDATYQGAFMAGKTLNINTVASSKTVNIHYDEQAGSVPLDGTNTQYQAGEKYYNILSWQTE